MRENHDRRTFSYRIWVPIEAPCGCRLIRYLIPIGYLINSCTLCFIRQVAILWYSGAAFGPRIPPFFGCQTRKISVTNQHEVSGCIPNI